jgi:hypothetical protein
VKVGKLSRFPAAANGERRFVTSHVAGHGYMVGGHFEISITIEKLF